MSGTDGERQLPLESGAGITRTRYHRFQLSRWYRRVLTIGPHLVHNGPERAPRAVSPQLESDCGFSTMGGGSPPPTISGMGSASTGQPVLSIRRMESGEDDSGGTSVPGIMLRPRGDGHRAVAYGPTVKGNIETSTGEGLDRSYLDSTSYRELEIIQGGVPITLYFYLFSLWKWNTGPFYNRSPLLSSIDNP